MEAEFIHNDEVGSHVITDRIALTVKHSGDGRVFKRNAMRVSKATAEKVGEDSALVGELNGIRVYAKEHEGKVHLIMTDEDLYL